MVPDVLLVTDDAGPPEVLEQIANAGIDIDVLLSDYTLAAVLERVERLAQRFDKVTEGQALGARIEAQMRKAQALADQDDVIPRAAFLLGTGAGSAMAAGTDTAANAMLTLAGASNVLADFEGYKPISAEAMIAAAPDAIVVVAHGDSKSQSIVEATLSVPGVADTPAGKSGHIIVADALQLLGFGPRIGEATHDLVRAFQKTSTMRQADDESGR